MPAIVGRRGLEEVLEIPLSPGEREALTASARQLQQAIVSLGLYLAYYHALLGRHTAGQPALQQAPKKRQS